MVISISACPFAFMILFGIAFIALELSKKERSLISWISLALLLLSVIAFEVTAIYVDPIVGSITLFFFVISALISLYFYHKEESKMPVGIFYISVGITCVGFLVEVAEIFLGKLV